MASERLDVILNLITGNYKNEARAAATATGRIGEEAKKTAAAINNIGPQMATAGRAMAGFGVAVVAGFGLAAKAAIDWQTAFAGVRKTVDASEAEFAALEQGLLDISLRAPITAEELAKIAESAGQLGIANDAILEFTETVAALGVTTNLTTEEAATSFARLANIMQIPQDQFDEMGSTIVDLGNNMATTEREIVDFALRIAGAGKVAGLATADVFAIGASFSSVGVEAEAGGTAVQKVLLGITQAVATGSKDLEVFAAAAGVSARQFTEMWRSDPAEAFTLFVEGLGRAGDDAFVILEKLGLQDQRLIRSFLSLAGAGDLLRTSLDLGNAAWEENSALTDEAAQRYATVASELTIAFNAAKVLAIEIGNLLLPAIRFAAGAAKDFAEFLADLPDPLKVAAAALAGITGGFALMGGAALILIPKIAATIKAVRDLRIAILALRAAQAAGALGGVASGAVTAGGAIAAGGAAGIVTGGALVLEKVVREQGQTLGGYVKFLYDVGQAAHWLGMQFKKDAAPGVDALTSSLEGSDRHLLLLNPALRETGAAADELAVATLAAGLGIDETSAAALLGIDPLEELGEAAQLGSDRLHELADAQRDATRALLESANPAIQASAAIQRYQDAQKNLEDVLKDVESTEYDVAAAQLEVVRTALEAQGALDAFSAANPQAQIQLIADVLGISDDAARDLLETLGLIDGTQVSVVFNYSTRTTADAAEQAAGQYIPPAYRPPSSNTNTIDFRQHGGAVYAGRPYMVGENGMEMFIPQRSGMVLSSAATRQLLAGISRGGGDWNINLNGVHTVDRGAIDLLGTMAGVQRRVEARR